MICYTDSMENITSEMLEGFFGGWRNRPSSQMHLKLLNNSEFVVLALDDATGKVVGFINALSDGALFAYVPMLEVLPKYRGRGIGKELTKRMLKKLKELYAVDLLCDPGLQSFYISYGMSPATGMTLKNYER